MADKFWCHGTQVLFDSVPIGGLTAIGLPDQSKEEVEVTSHDSEGWREFVPGLRDGGSVSLTARIKPSDPGQQALHANFNSDGSTGDVVISLPPDPEDSDNVVSFSFEAFVMDTGGSAPFDGAGEFTWTLRISGLVQRSDVS